MGGTFDEILSERGFTKIGLLSYRLNIEIWWNPKAKIEVLILRVRGRAILRGSKSYYLISISKEGEMWARDIGPMHNWLEKHFPDLHLAFTHFRDITDTLAASHIGKKLSAEAPTLDVPTAEQVASLQERERAYSERLNSTENIRKWDTGSSPLIQSRLKEIVSDLQGQIQQARAQLGKEQSRLSMFENLQKEYKRKGAAACLVFSIGSNVQGAASPSEFGDALDSIVKELLDYDRFQVNQKLGGKLNINAKEASEPVMVWVEERLGGSLCPRQVARLGFEFSSLREVVEENLMVTPKEDIRVNDNIKDEKKLLAPRVVSALVRCLDTPQDTRINLDGIPKTLMPLKLGLKMQDHAVTQTIGQIPLARITNGYISGSTGAGKSYMARVVIEEIAQYSHVNQLVIDLRNGGVGLRIPADNPEVLSLYGEFGMESPQCFNFKYYAPEQNIGSELPADLAELGRGRCIVSLKWLSEKDRCKWFGRIADSLFYSHAHEESELVKLVIHVDEAHLITKKRVSDEAKEEAAKAEVSLDRLVREGRKYGLCIFVISQSIKDFSYSSASIRQNTNTKVFLRNSDREIEYAADFIGNGKQIIQLPPGIAFIHNSEWGVLKVKVRPPFSKVWEYSLEATRRIVSAPVVSSPIISKDAQRLLTLARTYHNDKGESINLSQAAQILGITSKRMLQNLVAELERAGQVRTRRLSGRGQPRIIDPVCSHKGQ